MPANTQAVVDMKMAPADDAQAITKVIDLAELAANPAVDVDKLERLIALRERDQNRSAEEAFNVAYMAMSEELPIISERGQILNKQNLVQSQYAKFEDIQRIIAPILRKHGFALSFRTEWPETTIARITGILTHRAGHARESSFQSTADTSGGKNAVQGMGSAVAYGRRYTTIDLLNLVTVGADDDGAASARQGVKEPEGFEQAWLEIQMAADDGIDILTKAWKDLSPAIRNHAFRHYRLDWEKLKKAAQKVTADMKAEAAQ